MPESRNTERDSELHPAAPVSRVTGLLRLRASRRATVGPSPRPWQRCRTFWLSFSVGFHAAPHQQLSVPANTPKHDTDAHRFHVDMEELLLLPPGLPAGITGRGGAGRENQCFKAALTG